MSPKQFPSGMWRLRKNEEAEFDRLVAILKKITAAAAEENRLGYSKQPASTRAA